MQTRVLATVVLTTLVLLTGVAPAVGVSESPVRNTNGPAHSAGPVADAVPPSAQQYKVTLQNATIQRWLLRNATVRNVTVRTLTVRNVTTPNQTQQNVTLQNVTVERFFIRKGRLMNVTAKSLVIRNKSVLNVPGADLINPTVKDRIIESHTTRNETVSGLVIDTAVVDAADLRENATIGPRRGNSTTRMPSDGERPDITVEDGNVGLVVVKQGEATNWTVDSTDGVNATA